MNYGFRNSFIDEKNNIFVIPVLGSILNISIPWGEEESCADLEKRLNLHSNFIDQISIQFIPECEETLENLMESWPWSLHIYTYEDHYILSTDELENSCPSMMPQCIAIPLNRFVLKAFIRDFCLPFIREQI